MATLPLHARRIYSPIMALLIFVCMCLQSMPIRATEPLLQTVVIESIRVRESADSLTVLVRSTTPIAQYQRPEKTPSGWILRFPNSSVQTTSIDTSAQQCSVEQIRSFGVVRIRTVLRDTIIVRHSYTRDSFDIDRVRSSLVAGCDRDRCRPRRQGCRSRRRQRSIRKGRHTGHRKKAPRSTAPRATEHEGGNDA
jgi:hypothetical protein